MHNITGDSGTWRRFCGTGGDDCREEDFLEKGTCKSRKEGASRTRQEVLKQNTACAKAQRPDGRSKVSRKQAFGIEG